LNYTIRLLTSTKTQPIDPQSAEVTGKRGDREKNRTNSGTEK